MLEVGWSEILVVALVLIIVVGPKELPGMLRNFGKMATRVRGMANDFKGQFDQAMREADMEDVSKGLNEVRKLNPTNALRDAINPLRQLGQDIRSDLQKASDFTPKTAADTGTKLDDLVPDPAISPEPIKSEPTASTIMPAAAMPVISPAVAEPKPKPTRKKTADPALEATADALAAKTPVKKPPAKKAPAPETASSDPLPPSAKKVVLRKPDEKQNVHVVAAEMPAAAPKKPAPKKKTTKTGDA